MFADTISDASRRPPELGRLLDQRSGDVFVVTNYDNLVCSLRDLLDIVEAISILSSDFQSLAEDIDTTTPPGHMIIHVFASIAQFERERISERTKEGLEAARRPCSVLRRPLHYRANSVTKCGGCASCATNRTPRTLIIRRFLSQAISAIRRGGAHQPLRNPTFQAPPQSA